MKCVKCGKDLEQQHYFFVPAEPGKAGGRFCIKCAREEKIVTLV